MNLSAKSGGNLPDFAEVRKRFETLSRGDQAQIGKRIGTPDDLSMVPAFYKLFPGITPNERHRQVAFFLPWCKHSGAAKPLGSLLAAKSINEKRLFQVVRSEAPSDLVYLRRLLQRLDLAVDWNALGKSLFFWHDSEISKRQLIEQYFIARHAGKGE